MLEKHRGNSSHTHTPPKKKVIAHGSAFTHDISMIRSFFVPFSSSLRTLLKSKEDRQPPHRL